MIPLAKPICSSSLFSLAPLSESISELDLRNKYPFSVSKMSLSLFEAQLVKVSARISARMVLITFNFTPMNKPSYTYSAKILRVIDGDSYEVLCDVGFRTQIKITVRLFGINTPEIRGEEKEEGNKVKSFVKAAIEGKDVLIKTYKSPGDKYGRWLAEIISDFGEGYPSNLTTLLLSMGYGEEYYG